MKHKLKLIRENNTYGITLIALVITIVVLLILAGVSIATLTGPNGLLTRAQEAKNKNTEAGARDKISVEVLASYGTDGKLQLEDLKKNIEKIGGTIKGSKFPLTVTLDNYEFGIRENGQVILPEEIQWNGTVNSPKLSQGMIPIKWESGNWLICSEEDPEWYEYVNQKEKEDGQSNWANIMLSDGKYKAGTAETENAKNNSIPIKEEELGSMFVWIPRYAYQIESLYHESSADSGGKINIEFLVGTKKYNTGDKIKSGQLANKSGQGNWNEHPAFTFGDKILSGIWVAKFEASSTTLTPDENYGGGNVTNLNVKVLPGKQSWRNINISNIFTNCINMNNSQNASIYGISSNDNEIDPHLMKNNEWGVVAYLTQSSYGRNGNEVTPNSNGYDGYKYIYTGYAGEGNSYNGKNPPENVHYYNTKKGMLASTTGNITGIYDISGGTWEYVAGYVNNGHSNLKGNKTLFEADAKYKNVYKAIKADGSEATAGDEDIEKSYENMQNIYGNAIWETSKSATNSNSWYEDHSQYPNGANVFFDRGGAYANMQAGIFNYSRYVGIGHPDSSFRPTLAVY